ncbi:MAG: hybrid sensor histidine kinase/response regulator [Sphingobacteriaceae bacterium]|nr:hybrid sensor histidine kinase/response regulator [Sphingobacteriaceae bacterium]
MINQKIAVLYVDDERHNLYAFRASFRNDYQIFIAESAEEGRAFLAEHEIPVVVADQRMPKETGIEFLESIKKTNPHTMRILLTGYTDIQAVISAVNMGNIFRYLQKPWQEEEIREAINSAFEVYHTRVQLIEKNIELEKAYQELDKFVYSASHDMRSPLMSILGIVRLSRMEKDLSNTEKYFDMIEESVQRMDEFIKNIIGYYRNNRIEVKHTEIDLELLVEDILRDLDPKLKLQNIELRKRLQCTAPLVADRTKLQIILTNLISNAYRYQKQEGAKWVEIRAEISEQQAAFEVADGGIGIATDELEGIFKMFHRATNNNPGSGVGLYITKDAVNRIGGTIEVTSVLGEGSVFRVSFPNKLTIGA